jgi:DNA-binding CsgD family transcriptional regulator
MSDPPFHAISIAPGIAIECHLLRFPLTLLPGPDNTLAVYQNWEKGWDFAGSVERVWWAGDLVLVQARQALYLLRAESLPQASINAHELAILRGLAAGWSTHAIAQQIYLTEGTIEQYIKRLRAKLGANHRAQLIAIAKDQGLI